MDKFWDLLASNAFAWIGAVLTLWTASHALHSVLEWLNDRYKGHNHLIAIIEVLMILIIGIIAMHEYFHPRIANEQSEDALLKSPIFILVLMVIFSLLSIFIYQMKPPSDSK